MTRKQLQQAVASKLGESLREVRRRGFSLADPARVEFDPEPSDLAPQTVDWDALALVRNVRLFDRR